MEKIIFINIIIINRFQRDLLCVLMEKSAVTGQTPQLLGHRIKSIIMHTIDEEKQLNIHYWTGPIEVVTNGKADLHAYPKGKICIPPSTCRHVATSFYNMLKKMEFHHSACHHS